MTHPPGVAIVTGGLGGIGAAIADGLAGRGDRVVLVDVRASAGTDGKYPVECVDVADVDAVLQAFHRIEETFGTINILVNSAGVMCRKSATSTSTAEWTDVIGTNLTGTFACSVAAATLMVPRRSGWIVNIGSIWAQHVWPERAAYSASKAAVEQLTRCMALELINDGVHVNCISPGMMETPFTKQPMSDPAFQAAFMPRLGLHEVGKPERDLVDLALWLTSPASTYMVGEVVNVHGGFH